MWIYLAIGVGIVLALNIPLVFVARALAPSRARERDELGRELLARLEQFTSR